jgi:hypothetical protein
MNEEEAMSAGDEGVRHFLLHWFSGLVKGLESVDQPARRTILRACGKACAASYTAEVFTKAREHSTDMAGFLAVLASKFPGATYEQLTANTIRVRYARCACDLVKCGWVKSPLLCRCSVYNLQENFERAWGIPVSITLESTILEGAPQCAFMVSLGRCSR